MTWCISPKRDLLLALTPASQDYNHVWRAGDNTLDWSTSWKPLSSFSECLSARDAMPCLLWAAVMWVRSISAGRLSVWLHSSMSSAGQSRRSPQYRPEHNLPRDNWRSIWDKVNTREGEWERKRKQRAERPGQTLPFSLPERVVVNLANCLDPKNAWGQSLKENYFKSTWTDHEYKISETNLIKIFAPHYFLKSMTDLQHQLL